MEPKRIDNVGTKVLFVVDVLNHATLLMCIS
jgi:hypothetical protein